MVELLKAVLLPLLKLPARPPEPPTGHHPGEFLKTFRAAPAYLHYRLLGWWIYAFFWMFGVLGVTVALLVGLGGWGVLLALPLLGFAVSKAAVLYVTTRLDYEMRWYILTERSLRVREGTWIMRELTLTYANVQNVHVLQGPIERLFGFANVMVETAGGGGGQKEQRLHDPHKAVLRGLDNPAEVRDLILKLLRRYRTAGLGDHEERFAGHAASTVSRPLSRELLAEVRDAARTLREAAKGILS